MSITEARFEKPRKEPKPQRPVPLFEFTVEFSCGHTAVWKAVGRHYRDQNIRDCAKTRCPDCKNNDPEHVAQMNSWRDATWPEDADTIPAVGQRGAAA